MVGAPKYLFKEFTAVSMSSIKLYSLFVTLMSQAKKKNKKNPKAMMCIVKINPLL